MRFTAAAHVGRQLPERDARFARDEVAVQDPLAAFGFQHAVQRPQRRHAAAAGDLQADLALADDERQHAVGRFGCRRLQRGDAERETERLQFRRAQHLLQSLQMACRNADEAWRTARPTATRTATSPPATSRRRTENRVRLRSGESWRRRLPAIAGNSVCAVSAHLQRHGNDAMPLAHTGRFEMVDESRARPVPASFVSGSSDSVAVNDCASCSEPFCRRNTTPSSRLPSNASPSTRGQRFALPEIHVQKMVHRVSFATQVSRTFFPSAQPSRLKSWRYTTCTAPALRSKTNRVRR